LTFFFDSRVHCGKVRVGFIYKLYSIGYHNCFFIIPTPFTLNNVLRRNIIFSPHHHLLLSRKQRRSTKEMIYNWYAPKSGQIGIRGGGIESDHNASGIISAAKMITVGLNGNSGRTKRRISINVLLLRAENRDQLYIFSL